MGKSKVLVKVHPEGKYVVDLDKSIDIGKLTPGALGARGVGTDGRGALVFQAGRSWGKAAGARPAAGRRPGLLCCGCIWVLAARAEAAGRA
jgi:hypothetical protein